MKYKKINKIFIGFRKTGPKTEKDIFILSKWLIIVSLVFIRPPVIKKTLIRMSVKNEATFSLTFPMLWCRRYRQTSVQRVACRCVFYILNTSLESFYPWIDGTESISFFLDEEAANQWRRVDLVLLSQELFLSCFSFPWIYSMKAVLVGVLVSEPFPVIC